MTNALDQSILELLQASRDDEETVHLPVNDRTFGFHMQQAIEKLKALIAGHGKRFEYTHDIQSLVKDVVSFGDQLPVATAPLEELTAYAGIWRYQEPTKLTIDQKTALKADLAAIRGFVIARLAVLRPSSDWKAEI